ncbi:hypothetical protein GTP91_22030 [Rugamonas sp. FT82W]|uniref:SMI1/KNR4 family protein n=1 Tax=Duganella vulcania TaxID=2692166 RepID=A0A845G9G8_9BURK|nr:SMI1/KNR4 family protein [Duganella vulcania]MYM89846.1 hypothetical protein [Duganella vulcania]
MSILQELTAAAGGSLKAGLNDADLHGFECSLPGPLPSGIKELLRYAAGLECPSIGSVDFTGRSNRFEFREIVPYGIALAESNGNFWVQDIAENGLWGRVFFFCHDPATVVLQFDSLCAFVKAAIEGDKLDEEANRMALVAWQDVDSGVTFEEAIRSDDVKLVNFAQSLPDNKFRIFDLRSPIGGNAFAWGRGGHDLVCRRAGTDLIFAVAFKASKKGIFSRIFE